MKAILKLRENQYAPVSEILNLCTRGTDEAQKIAGWYAATKDYDYWEIYFNQSAANTPRLIRNGNQLRIARG